MKHLFHCECNLFSEIISIAIIMAGHNNDGYGSYHNTNNSYIMCNCHFHVMDIGIHIVDVRNTFTDLCKVIVAPSMMMMMMMTFACDS